MGSRPRLTVVVALVAGAAGWWWGQHRQPTAPPSVAAPASVPGNAALDAAAIAVADTRGKPHTLSEWNGAVRVVNFWATWCPPCLAEVPVFIALQQEWGERGLQFVGIALDDLQPVREFTAARGVNYPILVGEDEVMAMMRGFGNEIGGLPFTVVLDRAGQVVHTQQGEWKAKDARAVLEPLLGPPPQP